MRGMFLVIDGIDGSGKSTQARLLADRLGAYLTFEPGHSDLGEGLRRLILDTDSSRSSISRVAEALVMFADRAQHVFEVIGPKLEAGSWVVSDRFSPSTFAYQGFGRGLEMGELDMINTWACQGIVADLNILIDIPVQLALSRRQLRRSNDPDSVSDRFELEQVGFQEKVREGFLYQAKNSPQDWIVIDGQRSQHDIQEEIFSRVSARFNL